MPLVSQDIKKMCKSLFKWGEVSKNGDNLQDEIEAFWMQIWTDGVNILKKQSYMAKIIKTIILAPSCFMASPWSHIL